MEGFNPGWGYIAPAPKQTRLFVSTDPGAPLMSVGPGVRAAAEGCPVNFTSVNAPVGVPTETAWDVEP